MYLPFADGGLTWRQMFTLHNEHRIFFTRVLAMTLLLVNGQWDPQLQIVVNIALHALTAVIRRRPVAGGRPVLARVDRDHYRAGDCAASAREHPRRVPVAVLFPRPVLGPGDLAVGTRPAGRPPGSSAGCVHSPRSSPSPPAILFVAAIGAVVVLRTMASPRAWRKGSVNVAALAAVAAVGYLAMSPPLPYHGAPGGRHLAGFRSPSATTWRSPGCPGLARRPPSGCRSSPWRSWSWRTASARAPSNGSSSASAAG